MGQIDTVCPPRSPTIGCNEKNTASLLRYSCPKLNNPGCVMRNLKDTMQNNFPVIFKKAKAMKGNKD